VIVGIRNANEIPVKRNTINITSHIHSKLANFVLPATQIKLNYPIDNYALGNSIFIGCIISGSVFAGLGVITLVLSSLSKRK